MTEAVGAKIDQQGGVIVTCERKQFTGYTRPDAFESRMGIAIRSDSVDRQLCPGHQRKTPHDDRLPPEAAGKEIGSYGVSSDDGRIFQQEFPVVVRNPC